jgi:hypothetical protein
LASSILTNDECGPDVALRSVAACARRAEEEESTVGVGFAELKAQAEAGLTISREEEGYSLGLQAFEYGYPAIEMYRSRWE